MQYRKNKKAEDISILGFGCMRLPTKAGLIDFARSNAMIHSAIEQGVNYFDTAYIYHAGQSETFLGKSLKGVREKVNIATKLPLWLVNKKEDIAKIFDTQLKRLQTDYIDYYLMHAMKDLSGWEKLVKMDIIEFIEQKKSNGTIRNIGFSFHGNVEEFIKIVDAYDWDFCQIQWNYMNEFTQAGTKGLEYAASKGLPVIIMGPQQGGNLAKPLAEDAQSIFDNSPIGRSNSEWALRWVWNHPAVTCALSGMSTEEALAENIKIASEMLPNSMSDEELKTIESVRDTLKNKHRIPCTGCGYCMPCPMGVNIPECFNNYNEIESHSKTHALVRYISFTSGLSGGENNSASLCIKCGKCVKECPQEIDIPSKLESVRDEFEGFLYKAAMLFVKLRSKRGKNAEKKA